MKRWDAIALVLVIGAAVMGCSVFMGEDGKAYGQLSIVTGYGLYESKIVESYDGSSGLPDSFYLDTKYEYDDGDYDFYYRLTDGYSYMSNFQYVEFTVEVNKGAILKDGKDKNFTMLLDWYDYDTPGLKIIGDNGVSTIQEDGSMVYSNGELSITAKNTRVNELPNGAVPLRVMKK